MVKGPVIVLMQLISKVLKYWFMNADTMDNWDEKKLEEVVNKKHGEAEKKKAKTQIVSSGRKYSCTLKSS